MPKLEILASSRGFGRCRSCDAKIEWAQLRNGSRMPFDGEIVPVKSYNGPTGEVIEIVDTDVTPVHFQTCPDAGKWRRSRK